MSHSLLENLENLSILPGAPGYEEPVTDYIGQFLSKLGLDFTIDRMGNLLCYIKGYRQECRHRAIHFDAHTDEPGFIVKHINPQGMIYTATIGYFNFDSVTGQRVRVITDFKGKKEIKGSFCVQSVHDSVLKSRSLENIWIDVGATSRNSVLEMGIKPGNSVVFDAPFCLLNGGKRALGKAFDNRASCAILLDSIYLLLKNPPPYDVFFSFSTQEEFILRGAHTVFNTIKRLNDAVPKISISLDIGICCVTSTSDPQTLTMEMGKGPGIKIRDKSNVSHYSHVTPPRLVAILEQIAHNNGIPFQYDFLSGCTNADVFATQHCGVYSGGLSFPTRNTHSPVEIVDISDLKVTTDLVFSIAKDGEVFDILP